MGGGGLRDRRRRGQPRAPVSRSVLRLNSWDPYLDLRSGVLVNRLGITDPAELRRIETDLAAARTAQLAAYPLAGDYDLAHLRAIHRHLFQDVYPWAGQLRTVAIGKGTGFCPPDKLVDTAATIFGGLRRVGYLRGLRRADFLDGVTELLAALDYLHCFREGNGRANRAFLAQLARSASYAIRWEQMDPDTNIAASRVALRSGDTTALRTVLDQLLVVGCHRDVGAAAEHPVE